MKYCGVPPGEDPMADAYNLTVAAWHALYAPKLAAEAERMVKMITASVTDLEEVTANVALIAAKFTNFADLATPEEANGKKYDRPSEVLCRRIERNQLTPA